MDATAALAAVRALDPSDADFWRAARSTADRVSDARTVLAVAAVGAAVAAAGYIAT